MPASVNVLEIVSVRANPYRQYGLGGNSVLPPIGVNGAGDRRSDVA